MSKNIKLLVFADGLVFLCHSKMDLENAQNKLKIVAIKINSKSITINQKYFL